MHRFRWLSLLGLSCTFGLAACGDDNGNIPTPPDAAIGPDAPQAVDAAPGDIDAAPGTPDDGGVPPTDGAPPPDAAPPAATGVVINEVVLLAQQDWGKSSGVGEPFDGAPGVGTVSSRDQFIEIYNAGTTAVSLVNWRIDVIDSSDGTIDSTPLGDDIEEGTVLTFSPGSTQAALLAGGYAVLGNPSGTIATDAWIVLRDNRSTIIDDVEIGDDRETDGDDGAPGSGQNGFSRGVFEESVGRPVGQADTNNDRLDFEKLFATPLLPNNQPQPSPSDTTAPRANAPGSTTNWPVTQFVRIEFSERLAAASIDPADLELRVNGVVRGIQRTSFANNDSVVIAETVGVLPFNATVSVTALTSVTDFAGNALAANATFTFQTEAAPASSTAVILNEICTDAQQDWNHSSGGPGAPFTNTPGTDPTSLSSSDEWIELLVSPSLTQNIDLTGYTIEVFNGPNNDTTPVQITELTDSKVLLNEIQFFSSAAATLASVPKGAFVVVGNPTGSMNNDVYVVLRDSTGLILDEVEIGGNAVTTDRGGDGIDGAGAGAPEAGGNGNASSVDNETVFRTRNAGGAVDTGDDAADWNQGVATIGQPN
jgi:hypothetical protein